MAILQFSNGKRKIVTHEVALSVWNILQGTEEPTPEQAKYVLHVSRVFLNWRRDDLPLDYRLKYQDTISWLQRYHSNS